MMNFPVCQHRWDARVVQNTHVMLIIISARMFSGSLGKQGLKFVVVIDIIGSRAFQSMKGSGGDCSVRFVLHFESMMASISIWCRINVGPCSFRENREFASRVQDHRIGGDEGEVCFVVILLQLFFHLL